MRKYVAVLKIGDDERRSPAMQRLEAMEWLAKEKGLWAKYMESRQWWAWLETQSIPGVRKNRPVKLKKKVK